MWQGARPNPIRFTRLKRVAETGEAQRALSTQRPRSADSKFAGVFVAVVLREENVGHILTRHTTLGFDEAGELSVGLSVVAHTIKVSGGFYEGGQRDGYAGP